MTVMLAIGCGRGGFSRECEDCAAIALNLPTQVTATDTVAFSGNCTVGAAINVSGQDSATVVCDSGQFTYTTAPQTTDGLRTYTFAQSASAIATGSWQRDTVPPTLSFVRTRVVSASDSATFDGACEAGLMLGGDVSTMCSGAFSHLLQRTDNGTTKATFEQTDAAGNTTTIQITFVRTDPVTKLVSPTVAANDYFGDGLDISGDVIVVGAPFDDAAGADSGAVYVYRFDGVSWVPDGDIVPSVYGAGATVGEDVAIHGKRIVVGAEGDNRMFVFAHNDVGWGEEHTEQMSQLATYRFGNRVDVFGDDVAVTAMNDEGGITAAGSFYTFAANDIWSSAHFVDAEPTTDARFASRVSIWGERMVVSRRAASELFVYRKVDGAWRFATAVQPSDIDGLDRSFCFTSIDSDDRTIICGAPDRAVDGFASSGVAYIFVDDGTTITEQARLTSSPLLQGARFGLATAVSGDLALISAPDCDDVANDAGAVFVYKRQGTSWQQVDRLESKVPTAAERFGLEVAIDSQSGFIVVGTEDSNDHAGAVYIYPGSY